MTKHAPLLLLLGMSLPIVLAGVLGLGAFAASSATAPGASGAPSSQESSVRYSKSGYDITRLSAERIAELASKLDEEAYRVTQRDGTEAAFCGTLLDNKKEGTYCCVVCGLPLYSSDHKFTSGTGWPSFYTTYDPDHVGTEVDTKFGMVRTEIHCNRCTAHLGHVFEDGPRPTGLRHCLNSASLVFHEKGGELPPESRPVETETAYFAAGCFWGVEHWFQKGEGVIDAVSGYMQGHIPNPTYKDVCYTDSGHAEAVKVVFDPKRISYRQLTEAFFRMHDPTQLNRQGPDVGEQYRSGIYTTSAEQMTVAKQVIAELTEKKAFRRPIVTEVEPAEKFYDAEDYHQDYIVKTGRRCHVTNPWITADAAQPAGHGG